MHKILPCTLQTLFLHPLPIPPSFSVPHSDTSLSADHLSPLSPPSLLPDFSLPWHTREDPPSNHVWQHRPGYSLLSVTTECGKPSPHVQVIVWQLCCAQCPQLCPRIYLLLDPSWEASPALTEVQSKIDTLGGLVTCQHTCCSSWPYVYHSGNLSNQWISCLVPRKVFPPPRKHILLVTRVQ